MQPRSGTGSAFGPPPRSSRTLRLLGVVLLIAAAVSAAASTNDTSSTRTTVLKDGDPINLGIGEFTLLETLSQLGGPLPLEFKFYYGSARNTRRHPDGLPFKFSHNLHAYLVHDTVADTIALEPGLAAESGFFKVGDEWRIGPEEPVALRLIESGEFYYVCDPLQERVSIYRRAQVEGSEITAVLRAILDRNGNQLTFEHANPATRHGPLSVRDGLGRSYTFAYATVGTVDPSPYLSSVTDHGGRIWRFVYEDGPADAPGRVTLRSVVDPEGKSHTFRYDTNGFHFVHALTRPRGNTPSRQFYRRTDPADAFRGVVETQRDAFDNAWTFSADLLAPFENPITRFTMTQPDGSQRGYLHEHFGRVIKRFTDEDGRPTDFVAESARDRVASVTDRRGQTHRIVYHPSGKIAAFVNARGSRIELSYVARDQTLSNPFEADSIPCTFFDLSRVDHPDGSFESFEYDARGNITATRDRAGARTTFAYDARGQVTASTNATAGVVRRVYDAHANLVSVADSDGVLTRYGYDALFRRTSVTNADDTVVRYEHDALDRLKAVVDERSTRLALAYDANGNLTQLTRAEGTPLAQTRTIEYDALDRLERFLDPAGFATTLSYTYRGALAEAVFPDNARIRIGYDRRQFPVQLVDESGKEFLLHRDPEGLPTLLRTAAGREFRAAFDAVGFPVEIFDGNTNRYRLAYDAGLRLTNIVDALGRSIGTVRDPEGRLAARTVPILGTTSYERNGLGLITRLSDFRGSTWDFEYTPMGRPKSIRDPAARTWAMTYDDRGRLETVVHPDGEVETILYDAVSSPIGRQFSSGLRLAFARDALRRITNTASIPVRKTFDVRDQPVGQTIHETTFTASYDARRRLRSLEYAALSTITYTYDARGLATRISDSRSGAFVELDHDDDRFLRSVRRSNGVTTRYERDPNGRVVRIQHVGKADLKLTRDATGDVVRSLVTGVLNVASHLPAEAVNFAYDAANQPGGAGFVHDSRGRRTQDPKRQYTWDAADRLLSVRQDGTTVLDEYTATGEVAIQSVQGADTEFFYHDAIPNRPVLAERRSGEFRRYYIYTPEGALVFAVEVPANTPSFHHFDVSGTTLFLTGANGSVTDSYGYTPYGRLVRHEGSSEQPFTFHGELGVRQVGATGLYQMGARFYDSWTARFLSRDPSWSNLLEVHTELNPYGFARQNPVRFADPTGHRSFPSLSSLLDVLARRNPQPGDVVAAPDANGFLEFGFRREQSEREENQRRAGQPDESFESFFSKSPFGKAPGSTKAPTDPTGFITASLGATATGQSLEQIVSPTLVRRMTPAESVRRIEVTKTTRDLAEEGLDVLPEIAPMRRDRCFGIDHCSLSGAGSTSGSRSRMPRVLLLAGLIGFWWLGRFAVGRPRP